MKGSVGGGRIPVTVASHRRRVVTIPGERAAARPSA